MRKLGFRTLAPFSRSHVPPWRRVTRRHGGLRYKQQRLFKRIWYEKQLPICRCLRKRKPWLAGTFLPLLLKRSANSWLIERQIVEQLPVK